MQTLEKLIKLEMLKVPNFDMDFYQLQVFNNLYLEFFLAGSRALITPSYQYITTGEATEQEIENLSFHLSNHQEALEKVKRYLIYDLSIYSSLLETNSFYIALNDYVLIARFVPIEGFEDSFEIKLYTINRSDLPANYKDKLYLGRDVLNLKTTRRKHFGLPFLQRSLPEQMKKVKGRIVQRVSETDRFELEQEYISDAENLVKEFAEMAATIINELPDDLGSEQVEDTTLINANRRYRELKHILIELEQSLSDIEQKMFEKELTGPVRYITKFKKDITNDINYIMLKVNGRITDHLNHIKI